MALERIGYQQISDYIQTLSDMNVTMVTIQQHLVALRKALNYAVGVGELKAHAWWFQSEKGTLCLSVRYGAKAIELAKGRNAIEVASVDQLASTLEAVKKAVISGELDTQITATAEAVKARFKK